MSSIRPFVLACAIFGIVFVCPLRSQQAGSADRSVVLLTDDEILIGDVVQHADSIEISNRIIGTITIAKSSIKQIRSVSPDLSAETASNAGVAPFSVSTQPMAVSGVSSPKALPSVSSSFGIAKLKISTAAVASLQRDQNYTGEIDLYKNWALPTSYDHGQRTWLILSPSYDDKWKAKHPSSNVTQVYSGSLQHTFLEPKAISINLLGHAYHNNTQGIRVEQAYAVGVSKDIDTLRGGSFELSADIRAILQTLYSPGQSTDLVGSGLSLRYFKVLPAKLTFQAVLGGVPVFNQSKAWEASGVAEVSYPVTPKVAVVLGVVDNYYEIAPKTFNKNYLKSTISIQYTPVKPK